MFHVGNILEQDVNMDVPLSTQGKGILGSAPCMAAIGKITKASSSTI